MSISRPTTANATVHRNLIVNRINRRYGDARYLWWWGKHGRAWWSSQTEDIEERMRRHQTIMMHRYSKALRRRAMWDREDSPPSWAWRLPGKLRGVRMDRKAMSSTEQTQAKMEEHEKTNNTRRPWEEFHQDFESFKAAVDKAIERDPYGTLFGRRLRSPPSNNNSSWTSWSWIFDPKEIKEDAAPENPKIGDKNKDSLKSSEKIQEAMLGKTFTQSPAKAAHTVTSSRTETTLGPNSGQKNTTFLSNESTKEYVYDPISGRKIAKHDHVKPSPPASQGEPIKSSEAPKSSESAARKSIFQSLFSEHGIDIPVKQYKPHKVYGYGGEQQSKSESIKPSKPTSCDRGKGFENSRKREYLQLRASILGNNIDTTAEYGGKYETEAEKTAKVERAEQKNRNPPAPDDDAPLFSGTTYASKAPTNEYSNKPLSSDWLVKEGFQRRPGLTIPSLQSNEPFKSPVREPTRRIEPALDRTKGKAYDIPVKLFGSKLQPSIDRVVTRTKIEEEIAKRPAPLALSEDKQDITQDRREDVDLLRASDVRAAAKMARLTKQQKEDNKKEKRAQLEKDFEARHENDEILEPTSQPLSLTTQRLSRSLTNVWRHIKEYPQGIVAKTMQTVGLGGSENWKHYVRSNSKSEELLKPLEFKDETLSKSPSIYKKPSDRVKSTVVAPTVETIETERNIQKRSEDLKAAAQKAAKDVQLTEAQLTSLAKEMKSLYESEHGEINIRHRQDKRSSTEKPLPPLRHATVKPGVVRNLEIEKYVSEFEPQYANLVDKAKNIKRGLHEVSLGIGALTNERAVASTAVLHVSPASPKQAITAQIVEAIEPAEPVAPAKKPAPVAFDSSYVLLNFSKELGEVQLTPLSSLIGTAGASTEKVNAMTVIGSLNNASAFVKHFVDLDKNGYELVNGGGDVLFFQKKPITKPSTVSGPAPVSASQLGSSLASSAELRSTIAAEEAASQPPSDLAKLKASTPADKKAATVLDEIPAEVPTPGPAAPTAPPINSSVRSDISRPLNRQGSSNKIRRQEEVFSGQRRTQPSAPLPEQPEAEQSSSTGSSEQAGIFSRITRMIRRTIFTAIAFGGGAYAIGVIAEGLGAQAQIAEGETTGPRKKVVMPPPSTQGQRPGIFSTESSR